MTELDRNAESFRRGMTAGMAMSIAFMLRAGCDSQAHEWWESGGLTIGELEDIGVDEYDLQPIRAAGFDQVAGDDPVNLQGSGPASIEPREA